MQLQHPVKVETRVRFEPGLHGAMLAPVLVGDFGGTYQNEPEVVFDEESFWKKFMRTIRVLGKEIELGPETPPLPAVLAAKVLESDVEYLRLCKLLAWLETAASPADALMLIRQLGNRG